MHEFKAFLVRLAKLLLRLALDESLRRGLPQVYKRLDAEVPVLMANHAPPGKIQGAIASAIAEVTGHRVTSDQIEAVIGLYSPVAAAKNLLLSRR